MVLTEKGVGLVEGRDTQRKRGALKYLYRGYGGGYAKTTFFQKTLFWDHVLAGRHGGG